jgi:hypothetical protein
VANTSCTTSTAPTKAWKRRAPVTLPSSAPQNPGGAGDGIGTNGERVLGGYPQKTRRPGEITVAAGQTGDYSTANGFSLLVR